MPQVLILFNQKNAPIAPFDNARGKNHINGEALANAEPSPDMEGPESYYHFYDTIDLKCFFGDTVQIRISTWSSLVAPLPCRTIYQPSSGLHLCWTGKTLIVLHLAGHLSIYI